MKFGFTECLVIDKKYQPQSAVTLVFLINATEIDHDLFQSKYHPGQHVLVRDQIGGKLIDRAYYLNSHPKLDSELMITVIAAKDDVFSNYLVSSVGPGSMLMVSKPIGNFRVRSGFESKHHVFFAAGIGIGPVLPMLREVLHFCKNDGCTLIYESENESELIFANEIYGMQKHSLGRLEVMEFFNNPKRLITDYSGQLKKENILQLKSRILSNHMEIYICGPIEFIETIRGLLLDCGFDGKKIYVDYSEASISNIELVVSRSNRIGTAAKSKCVETPDERVEKSLVSSVRVAVPDEKVLNILDMDLHAPRGSQA